jgi:hypothetical protein
LLEHRFNFISQSAVTVLDVIEIGMMVPPSLYTASIDNKKMNIV